MYSTWKVCKYDQIDLIGQTVLVNILLQQL